MKRPKDKMCGIISMLYVVVFWYVRCNPVTNFYGILVSSLCLVPMPGKLQIEERKEAMSPIRGTKRWHDTTCCAPMGERRPIAKKKGTQKHVLHARCRSEIEKNKVNLPQR
jgi:hypothetical protein